MPIPTVPTLSGHVPMSAAQLARLPWHELVRHADDCDADYGGGIARLDRYVAIRLAGRTAVSEHPDRWSATDAYLGALPILHGCQTETFPARYV